ncbi:MAG: hypothetical protein KGY45_04855 [Hadesarchaea archaeon]|nr:hypothetical protein [Hadesarchaea archaeon]
MDCPSCESTSVILDEFRGESICTCCGMVLEEGKADLVPEWHSEPGKESGRAELTTGRDITRHDMGLGSEIGFSRSLSPKARAKIRRLRKWHRRSKAPTYQEKSLRQALIDLDKLCEDLFLSKSLKAEVSLLYRKAKKARVTPGRDTWSVLAALIFIVLRMRKIPRTEKEISSALMKRIDSTQDEARTDLRNIRKAIVRELGIKVPRPKPETYLDRFTTKLELPEEVTAKAHQICVSLPREFKSNKAAYLVAASTIYVAAKELEVEVSIREIAKTLKAGISSISKTSKKIRGNLNSSLE